MFVFRPLGVSAAAASLILASAPALAQPITSPTLPPGAPAPATTPTGALATPADTVTTASPPTGAAGPGIDSAHAVDPAPGARGPYVGDGENAFYDVQDRIDRVEQRAKTQLKGAKQRQALADIRSIRSELATQKARHNGELRDWDRENLNHRLDQLEAQVGIGQAARGE